MSQFLLGLSYGDFQFKVNFVNGQLKPEKKLLKITNATFQQSTVPAEQPHTAVQVARLLESQTLFRGLRKHWVGYIGPSPKEEISVS